MSDWSKVKIVGQRKPPATPEECFWGAHRLQQQMEQLNPYPRPRGFVFKARTYADYERWRKAQKNPRLW